MITKSVVVNLPNYAEARPVAEIVQTASQFESRVHILYQNKKINAKSIMGMMSLGLCNGEELDIMAEGADEEDAATAIVKYLGQLD